MRVLSIAALLVMLPLASSAQKPTFEVASVRPSAPNQDSSSCVLGLPGATRCSNVALRDVISISLDLGMAGGLNSEGSFRLIGGPNELLSKRFDIDARTTADATIAQKRQMLRALLEDRFKLRLKQEVRQVPVFVVTRHRDRLGPEMKPSTVDCNSDEMRARRAAEQPTPCGALRSESVGGIRIFRNAGSMSVLSRQLQGLMGRPVLDETGLTGTFQWSTKYRGEKSNIDINAPLLVDAVRQDLGLQITQRTRPYEVFVIESVEALTAN
jgi:uncharacterized protein (TIGR03435 family)